jgi:hypothetical protein
MPTVSTFTPDVPHDGGAVSWAAVIAGAVGAATLSLVLFVLGTGLGLAVISPWSHEDTSGTTVTVATIAWITFVQLAASVLGGYLAGRLRSRWVTVHTNEVFFRDTAHGFLAWAVSTLLMATLLSSAIGATVSTGLKAGSAVAGAAVAGAAHGAAMSANSSDDESAGDPTGYYVDMLFRGSTQGTAQPADKGPEVARIFANGIRSGGLSQADAQYLGQLVAAQTGLSQPEAEKRVTESFNQLESKLQQAKDTAKKVADDARKASAWLALWLVVSLFVGAFVASFAATLGGRLRDSSVLART